MAQQGVREVSALARDEYGLRRLIACAAAGNAASRGVLRATGFVPVGEVVLDGQPAIRHILTLSS